jgi:hypothetical protein
MLGQSSSAYVRVPFPMSAQPGFDRLVLQMKYDDGFVAYLNGQEVARHNAPVGAVWNSTATGNRPDAEAVEYREFDISSAISRLNIGNNVLAIHGLNAAIDDPDFLVAPRLVGLRTTIGFDTPGYFLTPSPGETNATVAVDIGPFVSEAEHTPHQPADADDLVVTARIERSATDIGPVSLVFRRMYGPFGKKCPIHILNNSATQHLKNMPRMSSGRFAIDRSFRRASSFNSFLFFA